MTTNTNDTALIEAKKFFKQEHGHGPEDSDGDKWAVSLMHRFAESYTADLRSRLQEAEKERDEYREMCGAADQVRALGQVSVKWSLERFGGDWFAYSKNPTTRHPDALSAYKSLKGESNDG